MTQKRCLCNLVFLALERLIEKKRGRVESCRELKRERDREQLTDASDMPEGKQRGRREGAGAP